MKKLVYFFIASIAMSTINAQNISDALRYAEESINGTARFAAMSGAFGALGGDLSAISINPAGSAILTRPQLSISLTNYDRDNQVRFFEGRSSTGVSNLDLSQGGAAFVFNNQDINSPWRKFVISILYDQTNNFDDSFFASGTNTNSIDSYFLANAQGLRLDEISAFDGESFTDAYGDIGATYGYQHQQAFLGFESFILEPEDITDDANSVYFSNIAPGTFNQEYAYASTGYNGKLGVNLAMQYQDNLFIGVNLNSHFINYNQSTFLRERNTNTSSFVTEVGFENNLRTTGNGFSFQIGAISKVTDFLRLGVTYDSPIWYNILDETTQFISTVRESGGSSASLSIDPNVINVFPEYRLKTPGKVTGSAALIFGTKGLLSFDYSRKDFGSTEFRPSSDLVFANENAQISNLLGVSTSYRIGGELRHKNLSFRGGYRFEESPYNDNTFYGDLTGYSLGLGYSFGNTRVDLAYQTSERTISRQLYNVGLTDAALIDVNNDNISVSFNMTL